MWGTSSSSTLPSTEVSCPSAAFAAYPLLGTWSLRCSVVNTLRIRGCEPLGILATGLWLVPATGRVAFGILFDLPPRARFCGGTRHVDCLQDPGVMGLTMATFARGRGGRRVADIIGIARIS